VDKDIIIADGKKFNIAIERKKWHIKRTEALAGTVEELPRWNYDEERVSAGYAY
jgi:hypothetical protein